MEDARLGRTVLTVSRLCVGTMNFGWQIDEQQSHAILDRAIECGLTFVDTAKMYGSAAPPADRLDRPVPDAPHRAPHQGPLRRIVKLRRLAPQPRPGTADRRHFLGLVSEQCKYNLLTRQVELEVLPAAAELGIGILPYSPLHFGALSGALRKQRDGIPGRAVLHAPERVEPHRSAIERYEQLCADLGEKPTTVAIAWLLSRPEATAPILGPRTPDQLDLPIAALNNPLTKDALRRPRGNRPTDRQWWPRTGSLGLVEVHQHHAAVKAREASIA